MSGICGIINGKSDDRILDKALSSMIYSSKQIIGECFNDERVKISEVKLKFSKNKPIITDDYVIFINGNCYNFDNVKNQFSLKSQDFEHLILDAYKENKLDSVLNKIDGIFQIFIYDRKNKKINLISDRRGVWFIYYYLKDDLFIFGSEVKNILMFKDIDLTIDPDAFQFFMDIGYFPEDKTWFKNIKLIKPSTILEYDIDKKQLSQRYYWTYSKIKQQDISFEDAVNKLAELLPKSVIKRYNSEDVISVPLSGGLDSRMILASLDKFNIKTDYNLVTMGEKGAIDIKIAKQLAKKTNQKHKVISLDKDDLLHTRRKIIWDYDGLYSIKYMHGRAYINKYNPNIVDFYSGAIGGEVYGNAYQPKFDEDYGKIPNIEMYKHIYLRNVEKMNIDMEYYNTPHFHPFMIDNTLRKFSFVALNGLFSYFFVNLPFIDNDLLDFIFSIPDKYRKDYKLYLSALKKAFPNFYCEVPYHSGAYKPKEKNEKPKISIIQKIKNKLGINPTNYFFDYDKYVRNNRNQKRIKEILETSNKFLLEEQNNFYINYYKENYEKIRYNTDKILKLITVKLYFDKVNEVINDSI